MNPPSLPRRRLGKTNLNIPVIPFGTQGFGNNFGPVSDEVAVALVKPAHQKQQLPIAIVVLPNLGGLP